MVTKDVMQNSKHSGMKLAKNTFGCQLSIVSKNVEKNILQD